MNMLFSKLLSAEDKLHKNGFSLKIVLKIDLKKRYYFPSFIIRYAKIKIIFLSVTLWSCYFGFCIFVFLGRKKLLPHFLLWKYKENDDVRGKASHETNY